MSADEDATMVPEQRAALKRLRSAWGRRDGKTVLVTGATAGIGLVTARRLAGLGAEVLVHGRDPGRTDDALRAVRAEAAARVPPRPYIADLGTLAGVRDLAAAVLRDRSRLDVLVANAGVYAPERCETADGLELTFAVNVVAPILLASELLPALLAAAPARVVILSSASHWTGEIHWDDLQLARPGSYAALRAYDQSKLAVLMLTLALAHRLDGLGVTVVCLDPGDVATRMLASGWPELRGIAVEDGAVTSVYLASAPEAAGLTGVYLEGGEVAQPLAAALDPEAQERLWRAVEDVAGPLARVV